MFFFEIWSHNSVPWKSFTDSLVYTFPRKIDGIKLWYSLRIFKKWWRKYAHWLKNIWWSNFLKNEYEASKEGEDNETNDTVTEPETVHSLAESLLAISKIRTHLMALGEDQEIFESLQSVERIFIKKSLEQSNSKQTKLTNYFNVNQLTLK